MARYSYTWEEETLIIDLYTRILPSRLSDNTDEIKELSSILNSYGYGCVVSGIRNKMENLKSVDFDYTSQGKIGRTHIAKNFMVRWKEYQRTGFSGLDYDVEIAWKRVSAHRPEEPLPKGASCNRDYQAMFRARVLSAFDNRCCISNLSTSSLIQACHIKPNKDCIADNRIDQAKDVRNGLCMNVLYHKAFDDGLFTIDEDRRVLLSPSFVLDKEDKYFRSIEGKKITQTGRVEIGDEYLEYHRKNIFIENDRSVKLKNSA